MSKQKQRDTSDKQRRKITTLDDLALPSGEIEIEYDDSVEVYPYTMLSYATWQDIGFRISDPKPPISGADKRGAPVFDTNDPTYQRERMRAMDQRTMMRLVAFLDIVVPGETLEEQADALKQALSPATVNALARQMQAFYTEGDARVAARAEQFHRNGTSQAKSPSS